MKYWKIIFTLAFFLFAVNVYAWNPLGHMVVASIAYKNLNPTAKQKVDQMVADLHKEYPQITDFEHLAVWPDSLREQKIETFTRWHYIDVAFSADNTPIKNLVDTDNAQWALSQIPNVVKNEKGNPFERARFLAFLTHITGDIHQPLHTVSRIAKNHPDGDEGGNTFLIKYPLQNPQQIRLHQIWDNGCENFTVAATDENIHRLEHAITAHWPIAYFTDLPEKLDPKDWMIEGTQTAKADVYNTQENQIPSENYLINCKKITEQKVALAGYRLANLLNKLLM